MSQLPKKAKNDSSRILGTLATISTLIGTCLAIIALIPAFNSWLSLNDSMNQGLATKAEIADLNSEIVLIKQEQAKLNDQITALSQSTSQDALSLDVASLRGSVNNIDQRLAKIEGVIVQDPQRSLEIPFLRKDLENISTTTELQISALRQDVERSYNLVLVTIVALAIGVLAPALGNIFKKNKDEKD